jgi:hypothetical protein
LPPFTVLRIALSRSAISKYLLEVNDLTARIRKPIKFVPPGGGPVAHGYEATILADICDAVLSNVLQRQQEHIADQCEILLRGFARIGIIALVDEATGALSRAAV